MYRRGAEVADEEGIKDAIALLAPNLYILLPSRSWRLCGSSRILTANKDAIAISIPE
ncbi:hypothetical protein H6F77_03170 [Microcoleus sp. FACHB-831]|uniref:hypothetical protein n=1 Tax=Microcoleus sp. FACHB-831 TaxID=2692827 RepID=UPI0016839605|nr:hypothetical protein [Microcoleus sp. FACHB-831]MBD1920118.1 hypothetical protein [Microcoleus sp. FACHB-831]